MNLFSKETFKMKRKGIIPKAAWNGLVDLVWALSVQSVGGQMLMRRSADGTTLSVKRMPTTGSRVLCALGDLLVDEVNAGKFKIRSGYVHGGGSSALVDGDNLTATIGDKVYLKIDYTATLSNGVLLPGTMTAQSIAQDTTVPTDDVITISSLSGSHYRILGEWVDDGSGGVDPGNPEWVKDACGSYTFSFCNGTFSGFRGAPNYELF